MFAGPNGSGKSTIKTVVSPALLGVYINPDEIEEEIRRSGSLSLEAYRVATTEEEIPPSSPVRPLHRRPFLRPQPKCPLLLLDSAANYGGNSRSVSGSSTVSVSLNLPRIRDLAAGVMASEDTSPRIKNLPPLTQSCNLTICPP